jgi:glycerol-3-phosphate O-acyltransferase
LAEPRLGILNYIISDFDPAGRDVIFVPVALNYDRVLEDRFLIRADQSGQRKFRPPLTKVLAGVSGYLWKRMRGKLTTFGTANVSFGRPLSLRDFAHHHAGATEAVGTELMARIAAVIPILPVPLVARALLAGATTEAEVTASVQADLASLGTRPVPKPRRPLADIVADGLTHVQKRRLITGQDTFTIPDDQRAVLQYYANSIAHHF